MSSEPRPDVAVRGTHLSLYQESLARHGHAVLALLSLNASPNIFTRMHYMKYGSLGLTQTQTRNDRQHTNHPESSGVAWSGCQIKLPREAPTNAAWAAQKLDLLSLCVVGSDRTQAHVLCIPGGTLGIIRGSGGFYIPSIANSPSTTNTP